jgi:hypothetical protein
MPDTSVSNCLEKIRVANKYHKKWWDRFRVSDSIKYYEGQQWAGYSTYFKNEYRPSVVNLVFSTIEVQLPSLLFSQPIFNVSAKKTATDPEGENRRTQLQEAALNTFVTNQDSLFAEEVEAAIIDSFFAFGVVEIGLDANYIINPNADKPYLKKDGQILRDIEGKDIIQPQEVPEYEQLYIKRIHPAQIRVGGMDSRYLENCNWVAYYEYVDVLDLKGNKALQNTDKLIYTGARTEEFDEAFVDRSEELDKLFQSGDVIKLWHFWDQRRHEFHLFTDVFEKDYLFSAPYRGLPLFELKYHNRMRGFYPVPPVSQWLQSQDDVNIAQEQIRVHQRRGSRKYLIRKNTMDTDQMDNLMFGPDGTYAETEGDPQTAIAAVPLAPLDSAVDKVLILAKDNFNIVSGTRSEARGVADRTTATQAQIMDARSQIRESRPKIIIANWLNRLARQIMFLQQRITLPFWIAINNTTQESLLGNVQETSKLYQEITGMDIEGLDFTVQIDVTSMSPIDEQDQKNKFLEFMAIINNYPQIAMSPTLIRETAKRVGFKTNEKVLRELQDMALLMQAGQQAQINGALGQEGASPLGQREVAKATPSDQERITNQLTKQVGLTQ